MQIIAFGLCISHLEIRFAFYSLGIFKFDSILNRMKLKGVISHEGMRALERQFLPCLEKFGKQCFLLFTEKDVHLLQSIDATDGMQISARLENVSLHRNLFF